MGRFDRDNPELVANLQAVHPKSPVYGPALQALARLGTLDSSAPAERKAKAESDLLVMLPLIERMYKVQILLNDGETLGIADGKLKVVAM